MAVAVLREDLEAGQLLPGTRLLKARSARRCRSPGTPARGVHDPGRGEPAGAHRGVSVVRPGADDVRKIHRERRAQETSALPWSVPVPQPGLHAAVEDGRDARGRRDVTGMAEANQRFHRGVVELAGSPRQDELMSRTLAEMREHRD